MANRTGNTRARFPKEEMEATAHFFEVIDAPYMAQLLRRTIEEMQGEVWTRQTKNYGERHYVRKNQAKKRLVGAA